MNRSEIWRELLGLKWVANTTRQLTPPPPQKKKKKKKESPRLIGVCLVFISQFFTSNFNFPNPSNLHHFICSSIWPILRESLSQNAQKSSENLQKTAKQRLMIKRFSVAGNVTEICTSALRRVSGYGIFGKISTRYETSSGKINGIFWSSKKGCGIFRPQINGIWNTPIPTPPHLSCAPSILPSKWPAICQIIL